MLNILLDFSLFFSVEFVKRKLSREVYFAFDILIKFLKFPRNTCCNS